MFTQKLLILHNLNDKTCLIFLHVIMVNTVNINTVDLNVLQIPKNVRLGTIKL